MHGPDAGFESFQREIARVVSEDPRITLAGAFSPERLGEVLGGMDVLVVPSRWYENSPVVIYETFVAGVPAVATDLGGMSEVVEHGRNGLLFPLDDEQELARLLGALAKEPARIGRLRGGIVPVKTAAGSAGEHEKLYNDLMSGKRDVS